MDDQHLHFTWEIPEAGFCWLDTHPCDAPDRTPQPFLVADHPAGRGAVLRARRYRPLEAHTGLFRVFADTAPAPAAIKAFADRFGALGGAAATLVPRPDRPQAGGGHLRDRGEALAVWRREIGAMAQAVTLWELARHGDIDALRRHIVWEPDGSGVSYRSHPEPAPGARPAPGVVATEAWIAGGVPGDPLLDRLSPGDVVRPALYHVQQLVNDHLRRRASPRLLWDERHTHLRVHLIPDGLLGALWLQFARAIERDSEFRRCAQCGIWFELAPATARADKLYCSNACRTKAYRERQAAAVRLHAEDGLEVAEIARRLAADPAAVAGWLGRGAGGAGRRPRPDGRRG